ncbi:conserved hypothetical protein [Ricinus communis]|uniref:Uncharacterized protein n=1 Tax=Ricinus communis TaxID=3988 RepID=B9T2P8_RICCO|nr:conserved hypothetical protein [Ricinus communis]
MPREAGTRNSSRTLLLPPLQNVFPARSCCNFGQQQLREVGDDVWWWSGASYNSSRG